MAIHFDIRNLVKTRWAPNHLRNVRIQGWDRILREMKTWWGMELETVIETSFYELLKGVPRPKKPFENW